MRNSICHPKHGFQNVCSRNSANVSMRKPWNKRSDKIMIVAGRFSPGELNESENIDSEGKKCNPYRGMSHHPSTPSLFDTGPSSLQNPLLSHAMGALPRYHVVPPPHPPYLTGLAIWPRAIPCVPFELCHSIAHLECLASKRVTLHSFAHSAPSAFFAHTPPPPPPPPPPPLLSAATFVSLSKTKTN